MGNRIFDQLIIFEMANNHQGDVSHALNIIHKLGEISRTYQINAAIKFQYRNLDTMIHPDYKDRKDVKHIPRFLSTRLTNSQFKLLVDAVKQEGLRTMCTPFDEDSVDVCIEHGIEILKIASCSAIDWPLLEKVAASKKPVIISTAGKSYLDMDNIHSFLTHRDVDFAMLHCVGIYPVQEKDVQLSNIDRMIARYRNVPIGYSGHESPENMTIVQMAVAKGANIFERHVGHATESITLNGYSTDVDQIHHWIEAIQQAYQICGRKDQKIISKEEIQSMNELARGCFAKVPIQKGQPIKRTDVFFAMPCQAGQTTSGQFHESMIASKDYSVNQPIEEQPNKSLIKETRRIIHDVRGMLAEANIAVGNEFELELSHHYGLKSFREYGATIINIVNREYCKKLIVLLPGQQHPMHYHKIKEETFQILYGEMELILDGKQHLLHEGQVITVERSMAHAFSSASGCIFEEISTTHVKNDSYYEDPAISNLDLMERKTILSEW